MADPNQNTDPEPVDAEFEPASDLPDQERSDASRKGVGATSIVLFFLLAALAGGGLGFTGVRYFPAAGLSDTAAAGERAALTQAITAIHARLATVENDNPAEAIGAAIAEPVASINARLDALEAAPSGPEAETGAPDLDAINARLAALEAAAPAGDASTLDAFTARLDAAETGLASLSAQARDAADAAAQGAQTAIDPLLLQNLSDRLAALEAAQDIAAAPGEPVADPQTAILAARLDQVETGLDETRALAETARLAAEAAATSAARPLADTGQASRQLAARALALSALRDIAGTHDGFEAERAALAQLWRGNRDLAAMASYARAGVPTLEDLTADYPGDAIRDAAGPGRIFFGLIEVRQANPGSSDSGAMAISALAENRLALRDLEGTVALTERLDATALPAARDWLIGAQARLDLDQRLLSLRQALTEMAAAQGDDPS
jgi:hypothetical protein